MSYSFSEDEDAYIPTPEDAPYFSLVGNIIVQEYPENPESKEQLSDFENKLKLYDSLNHKNILSVNGGRKSSVHEGIESLDKHLTADSTLSWMQRLQICVDVADALRYLHFDLKDDSSVIHGNVNSSVILLNKDNFTPILHGFRYAVKVKRHKRYVTSKYYNGTLQYKDPAFESTGGLTHKSDVYSFGVVLFEVLFGLNASLHEDDNRLFAQMARHYYDEKRLDEKINDDLRKQMNEQSLHLFSQTAYFCLEEQQAKRPDMEQVFKRLKKALELHQSFVHPTAPNRLKVENMDHLKVQLSVIKQVTDDFSERYRIGSGGYGIVYNAKLELERLGGTRNVAIKRIINTRDEHAQQGFVTEIKLLCKCENPNIVSLLGFCDEEYEMILIYEFASNKSLGDYLGNVDKMTNFNWAQRINICLGIANGLQYLHNGMPEENRIIHRDIKSDNILLDDKWVAKIADFGLSRLDHGDQQLSSIVTSKIAGTPFYLDPVYAKEGKLKKKTDIYSLGVVLFEMFCGKLAYDKTFNGKGLAEIARMSYKDGTLKELIDPKIKEVDVNNFRLDGGVNKVSLKKFLDIAYKCVAETQNDRPTIKDVIKELQEALDYQKINKDSLHISLEEIKLGTQDFNDHKCIQKEGYWKQYVGKITHDNKHITVIAKRWNSNFPQFHHQFFKELKVLHEYKHENIVSLLGYCNENDEKIIVYEYPCNGSLAMHLDNASLTWARRLKICIDVATGLDFLHIKVAMMHTNIKSASILLDGDWKAKISNLELSAHLSDVKPIEDVTSDDAYSILPKIYHFMHPFSPYDIEQGYMTRDTDIYSLGVVLKEIWFKRTIDDPSMRELTDIYIEDESFLGMEIFDVQHYGMYKKSTKLFKAIVSECSSREAQERPKASDVVTRLQNALNVQEDYEEWKPKLPKDYKDIIKLSKSPDTYNSIEMFKDLYDTFSKGIILKDGKVLFSLASNGERNEMISARMFSYKNGNPHDNWCIFPQSRFEKVAHMLDVSNLMIEIEPRTQFLSPNTDYGVYLVFKFCDYENISRNLMHVDLKYREGSKSLHAYFATWRDDEWMMIELYRFKNQNEDVVFKFLLESLSPYHYRELDAIYVEGIEFRPIDNGGHQETKTSKEIEQVLKSNSNFDSVLISSEMILKGSINNNSGQELFSLTEVEGKKHIMLSAMAVVCNHSDSTLFDSKPSPESRFEKVLELLPQPIFRINCTIKIQMLSSDTEYSCYLVFKLSEKCQELHGPVEVRDLLHKNKVAEIFYFRSPSPWNIHDITKVPKQRKDGWDEVNVWKFNLDQLENECVHVNLKLISYEGSMSGLIVCGLEFRPM